MKKNRIGKIKYNKEIAKDTYKLVISSDVEEIKAGQFISIYCENKTLRRPFSVADFEDGEITVLYKLKGGGTHYIKNLNENDKIDFLAPLGNTFNFENVNSALLIGAGIGIAPMLFLKKELDKNGIKNFLISGFKDALEVVEGSNQVVIGGSVMDEKENAVEKIKPDIIYSCGPSIVLKMVTEFGIKNNIKTQIAMEKVMACGIGVCRGCIIELKNGKNASVCKDGPVFLGDEIKW